MRRTQAVGVDPDEQLDHALADGHRPFCVAGGAGQLGHPHLAQPELPVVAEGTVELELVDHLQVAVFVDPKASSMDGGEGGDPMPLGLCPTCRAALGDHRRSIRRPSVGRAGVQRDGPQQRRGVFATTTEQGPAPARVGLVAVRRQGQLIVMAVGGQAAANVVHDGFEERSDVWAARVHGAFSRHMVGGVAAGVGRPRSMDRSHGPDRQALCALSVLDRARWGASSTGVGCRG